MRTDRWLKLGAAMAGFLIPFVIFGANLLVASREATYYSQRVVGFVEQTIAAITGKKLICDFSENPPPPPAGFISTHQLGVILNSTGAEGSFEAACHHAADPDDLVKKILELDLSMTSGMKSISRADIGINDAIHEIYVPCQTESITRSIPIPIYERSIPSREPIFRDDSPARLQVVGKGLGHALVVYRSAIEEHRRKAPTITAVVRVMFFLEAVGLTCTGMLFMRGLRRRRQESINS